MIKSILSISIMAAIGLFIFAIALPTQANEVVQQVLGKVVTIKGVAITAPNPVSIVSSEIDTLINKKNTATPSGTPDNSPLSAANIIDATNAERVKAGLPPLKTNDKLAASAKLKVEDMITNQYFEHTSPSGKTVADLGTEVGYSYVVMGENLALGDFSNAQDLLQAWMNSPGHRANILNASYEDMGAYAAQGMYQGHLVWFAVQHFGTQRGVCPVLDTALKTSIDSLNASLQNQESQIAVLRGKIEDPNHVEGQAYSDLIAQFNKMVSTYNADLTISQGEIATYNQEVVAFNKCLTQYQTSSVTPLTAE
jgi:uncharacterized protein YkwD